MAVLSRKTCALAIQLLARSATRTKLELLLYEHEVNKGFFNVENKEKLVLVVFQYLEEHGEYERLLGIIQGGLKHLSDTDRDQLQIALMRDGYVATDAGVVPDEIRSEEHKTAIEHLIDLHATKLNTTVLIHHLKEAEALFRLEKWDASIGQARSFVEELLQDIAGAIACSKHEIRSLDKPVKVRNYLQETGFFDEAERKKLVDGVYGYFSEEGSHPGIAQQSTARICLSILWTFGFYVLEKFGEWKNE